MQQVFEEIKIKTEGQGFYNFTESTLDWIDKQKIQNGILNINILHTSASLVIQENADSDVLYDLKIFFTNWYPWTQNYTNIQLKAKMICQLISNLH